jgi:hypothetical protein
MASPTTIPIYTLSGGVGRQPDTKRSPFMAQDLDNCLISLERSVEKRPGFSILSGVGQYNLSFLPLTVIPHFVWFTLDRENRYLIIVDRNATGAASTLFYVMKIDGDSWTNATPAYQWDAADSTLVWNGTDPISANDQRDPIYQLALYGTGGTVSSRYNALLALGTVDLNSRAYMIYGQGDARKVLKTVQFGTNILYLNTEVFAGFTSGTNGKTVGLNGYETLTTDTIGGKVTYYTSTKIVKTTDGRMYRDGVTPPPGDILDTTWLAQYIPVEDFVYGSFELPWMGQSVNNFSEIRFPPDKNDFYVNNSDILAAPDDVSARDMLTILYDPKTAFANSAGASLVNGRGKIYYCDAPYLALDAGYYRIVNFTTAEASGLSGIIGTGKPFTQKVRTPDYCSVLDKYRMPQRLTFDGTKFAIEPIEWGHRTVGDRDTNPGPSPFMNLDKEARHVNITSLCNFRDRLFFSAGDVVFSSQLGSLEDLWIKDPSNITVADPIDVRAASNVYAEITAMLPFDKFLFLNTKSSVQFELKGDNGLISPLTAEISSTTFYSTVDLVDPQTLGSQIYFWDAGRLYIYLNSDSRKLNTAIEVSATVQGYLPRNIGATCTANAQSYVVAVDEDNQSDIYIYCNRFSGDQVVQSAFWRYQLADIDSIYGINVWDEYLYTASKRSQEGSSGWYLMRSSLEAESTDLPRIDYRHALVIDGTNTTAVGITTQFSVPYALSMTDCVVVLGSEFGADANSVYPATITVTGNSSLIVITGVDLEADIGKTVYLGNNYNMKVVLSTQYQRGQDNNIIDGVLNLKTLTLRHAKTGTYTVKSFRRGRTEPLISTFSATNLENTTFVQENGGFLSKVYGFADHTRIEISNNTPSPTNITQMEFRGIFSKKNSTLR